MRGIVLALAMSLSACASTTTIYEWGNYSQSLLVYTKNPKDTQIYADKLALTITKAEAAGKVPPGLYAEYGYAQLELNQEKAAALWFSKERDK